jgi:hypothetical protein
MGPKFSAGRAVSPQKYPVCKTPSAAAPFRPDHQLDGDSPGKPRTSEIDELESTVIREVQELVSRVTHSAAAMIYTFPVQLLPNTHVEEVVRFFNAGASDPIPVPQR